jgi:hypothetical protein
MLRAATKMQGADAVLMKTSIPFPLYAFAKDDNSMRLVESSDRILYHMEAIDIENEEYLFWDALGKAVCIAMKRQQVDRIEHCQEHMMLHAAFQRNADSRGITVDLAGSPEQVWSRLKAAERELPRKRSFFARFRR